MLTASRVPIPAVVQQHQEESATLRSTWRVLEAAPHVRLHQLRRLDDRIAAHLDGLAVAGECGSKLAAAALETPGLGEMFTAAVLAIENRDAVGLEKLLAIAEALPDSRRGVTSAFGWVSAPSLRGITKALLDSPSAFRRQLGLAACAMHQADPGIALDAVIADEDAMLRARALRVAGQGGRLHLLPVCLHALADEDAACRMQAARSGVLLGDRHAAVAALQSLALVPGPWQWAAMQLLLMVCAPTQANAVLKLLAKEAANTRLLIRATGAAGDAHYVPWLIKQMGELKLTRLAGESFSLITGLDLANLDLELKPPETIELGPNDDPNDDNVAMDEDDSLPWPDAAKITAWWQANGHRFAPGTRYFMGEPPSASHCLAVLEKGFQRQRSAAAAYLCLLKPGTPLFNTAAPAWRQQRLLAQMSA